MIAFTSSEFTMLSILLQKIPDAVGSMIVCLNKNCLLKKRFCKNKCVLFSKDNKLGNYSSVNTLRSRQTFLLWCCHMIATSLDRREHDV